jgi:ribosomal-protein-alanine N-acetyltransferase
MATPHPPEALGTPRLLLRRARERDADAILDNASDEEVTRYMVWRRLEKRDEVLEFLATTDAQWESGEEFGWVITRRDEGLAIGGISIRPRPHDADFGYVLHRAHWNRGIATEAARVVADWALAVLGTPRLWATTDAENGASIRVLGKLGLECEGLLPDGVVRPNLSPHPRPTYVFATRGRRG